MPRQFQFVAVSNPTGPVPSESRKLSHSHATREAHARERRLRMQRYQREVAQFRPKVDLAVFETLQPLIREPNSEWDPFSAIARPLSHQEYFLLNHYIRVVVPHSAMHCGLFDYPGDHLGQIMQDWVGLAITDKDLLDAAILLSACRDIVRSKPDDLILTRMALHYKQRGIETLRHALGGVSSRVSVLTIARALALAFDEEAHGEIGVARQHLQGIFSMAELSGGLPSLGLSGLLERIYNRFVRRRDLGDMDLVSLCNNKPSSRHLVGAVH